jgi:hypothetical protein
MSAFSASIGSPTPTLYNDQGIYNPIGQIDYGRGNISSIQNNVLWNKTTSTQALFVSTVNGATYPPPYNSTIIGNFNVTSTMSANEVFAFGDITSVGNVGASGNITGAIGSFTQVNSSGPLTATNATIGGVLIGPAGAVSATQVTASNVNISSINGLAYPPNTAFSTVNGNFNVRSTLTAYSANISTNLGVFGTVTASSYVASQNMTIGNNLTVGNNINGTYVNASGQVTTEILLANNRVQTPAIIGLGSINGSAYPPPLVSSFQTLNTSTLTASTITTTGSVSVGGIINATGTVTAGSFSSAGNYNGLSATYPGVNISIAGSGNITAGGMSANSGNFLSTNISSITTSTINGFAYPPPSGYNPNPSFSTVTVSSVTTTNQLISQSIVNNGTLTNYGAITAPGAVIGAVTLGGAGAISGAIVTATQGNFSGIVRTPVILNPAVGYPITFSSHITGSLSTLTVDNNLTVTGILSAPYEILTPALYTQSIINPTNPFSTITVSAVLTGALGGSDPLKANAIATSTITTSTFTTSAITMGSVPANLYTNIYPGTLVVFNTVGGYGATSITGGSVSIDRVNPTTNVALSVNGLVQMFNKVFAPTINTDINNSSAPSRIGDPINASVVPGVVIPGYGTAPFVMGKMLTSQYSFGVGFSFINGIGYRIPNLILAPNYGCYVKLIYQSRGNQTGNGAQIYGVYDIYVGLTDGIATVLQPALRQNAIFVQNSSINILYEPTSGLAEIRITSNVGSGGYGYVVDVTASWTIQPLFTYA